MTRSIVAVGVADLVVASVSGGTEQPPEPIETGLPGPHFGAIRSGPFPLVGIRERARPLGGAALGAPSLLAFRAR